MARMLHTMLRVGDMDRSVKFYTEVMGMKLLRTTDRPDQKYSLAFVGYDTEDKQAVIELTYNYGTDKYDLGTAFGHTAFAVDDVYKTCEQVKAKGGNVEGAKAIGKAIAQRAKEKGVTKVVFDRGGFLYHGRVKALADAAREAGLEF